MKKVTITLLTMISIFGIVVMGFLYQIRLRDAKIEDLKRERNYFKSQKSALEKRACAAISASILTLNNMNKKDQERLKKNEDYLDILDELN